MSNTTNTDNIVGPSSTWELTSTTINVRTSTWKRLQKYHSKYGDTFDSVISDILDKVEAQNN